MKRREAVRGEGADRRLLQKLKDSGPVLERLTEHFLQLLFNIHNKSETDTATCLYQYI
jgi:hypothetical protein